MEVVGLVAEGAGMSALACMPLGRRRALSCPDAERSRWAAKRRADLPRESPPTQRCASRPFRVVPQVCVAEVVDALKAASSKERLQSREWHCTRKKPKEAFVETPTGDWPVLMRESSSQF